MSAKARRRPSWKKHARDDVRWELELANDAICIIRRMTGEGLGFNSTFVDDEVRAAIGLAQRAVLAGLATDAKPDMLRRFTEAAEKHRAGHERALGRPIVSLSP